MKTKIITTTSLILAACLFMSSCGNISNNSVNEDATEEVITAMYQCPMKCEGEKTYAEAGTCPVCKMDLKKVEDVHGEHEEHDQSH